MLIPTQLPKGMKVLSTSVLHPRPGELSLNTHPGAVPRKFLSCGASPTTRGKINTNNTPKVQFLLGNEAYVSQEAFLSRRGEVFMRDACTWPHFKRKTIRWKPFLLQPSSRKAESVSLPGDPPGLQPQNNQSVPCSQNAPSRTPCHIFKGDRYTF